MNLHKIREDLHRIPELEFDVFKTRDYILQLFINEAKLEIKVLDFNALIMIYQHGGKEPFSLFRADMDALPIKEKTGCEYASTHLNNMHACGHDIHMTVLIGLIDKVLRSDIKRNVIFVFQPGEEGHGGALKIIESKVLADYEIAECYALHVAGQMPVGKVACKSGIIFGIPQEFDVEFKGVSAHIANPEHGRDALLAGVQFYSSMKQLIPQSINPIEPAVFQIGKAMAGVVRNSLADSCLFQGTHRTLTIKNRDIITNIIKRVAVNTAKAHDLDVEVKILATFDPVVNDPELYSKFRKVMDFLPYDFEECDYTLTGEDFGYFTTYYKGLMFWLGSGDMANNLHSSKFLPQAEAIEVGVNVMWSLLQSLDELVPISF